MYVRVLVLMICIIRRVASLDTEVYASGFTKDMDQDLQKEVCTSKMILTIIYYMYVIFIVVIYL